MHLTKFPLPLVVEIIDSRQLRLFVFTAHIAGISALFLAALPPVTQWSGAVLLTISLLLHFRPRSNFRLHGDEEGKLMLWREGKWQATRMANSSVVWPFFIVLRLATAHQRRYSNLVVLPDSLPATDFRRLRVWLRWRLKHEASTSEAVSALPNQ
jgi:toxin CptA